MAAALIDGKVISSRIQSFLQIEIAELVAKGHRSPSLAVILVGDDPASQVYVGHKEKACKGVGIVSTTYKLPHDATQSQVENLLHKLSHDRSFDGILLQLPLPAQLDANAALDCIAVEKDVDGLSPQNQGLLASRRQGLYSCTPLGCMELIKSTGVTIEGKHAVVIGRSILVGAPIATMLSHANATVTIVHSRTKNPQELSKQADILVVAAGKHHLVNDQWIKPGAIVIDVGMHRIDGKLSGDVDFENARSIAGFITPVPGGVGPMTIAMLLKNCVQAYKLALNR